MIEGCSPALQPPARQATGCAGHQDEQSSHRPCLAASAHHAPTNRNGGQPGAYPLHCMLLMLSYT